MRQRRALTRVTAWEYRKASKKEKGRILSTLVKQTRLDRVYAVWPLRTWGKKVLFTIDGKPVRLAVLLRTARGGWLTGARVIAGHAALEGLLLCGLVLGPVGRMHPVLAGALAAFFLGRGLGGLGWYSAVSIVLHLGGGASPAV